MEHFLLLLIPGIIGGMINAIAGGGGIIMYPALLASGLNPIVASATASLAIWPGSLTSVFGYRKELKEVPKIYLWLVVPCFIGSIIGSVLLARTNPQAFAKIAPWLILSAVLLLAVQSRLHRWLSTQTTKRKIHWHTLPLIFVAVFPLAIYGGFFGAGFGLMMLTVLGFSGLRGVHQINGIKNLCGLAMALVSTIYFTRVGLIDYPSGLVMAAGTGTGGYLGAKLAHKISTHFVHDLTVVFGLIVAIVLIVQT